MKTNRWVTRSRHVYRQLLRLYPQTHRSLYGQEMEHLFANQCQEAYDRNGGWSILALWVRTLADMAVSVVHEHLSDPQARLGLLEARPDTPLPWKGVLLVLIPGLIFFISQIEQLTSTNDWFFIVFYRAAYFLMVPVLLTWLFTRRFPVWGLIPVGLLYGTMRSYNPGYLLSKLPFLSYPGKLTAFGVAFDPSYSIPVLACLVLLCGLIWRNVRQRQISRAAWGWLAVCGLLIVSQVLAVAYNTAVSWPGLDWVRALGSTDLKQYLAEMSFWYLYDSLPVLLLIFIGQLFVPRHEGLSFLVLLGYMLPTVIFGRYGIWNEFVPFSLVVLAVLAYRFIVALVAPIWLVRAASVPGRQRAAAIPVAVAIICQVALNVIANITWAIQLNYQLSLLDRALVIWNQLIIVACLGLAVALYLPKKRETSTPSALAALPE